MIGLSNINPKWYAGFVALRITCEYLSRYKNTIKYKVAKYGLRFSYLLIVFILLNGFILQGETYVFCGLAVMGHNLSKKFNSIWTNISHLDIVLILLIIVFLKHFETAVSSPVDLSGLILSLLLFAHLVAAQVFQFMGLPLGSMPWKRNAEAWAWGEIVVGLLIIGGLV